MRSTTFPTEGKSIAISSAKHSCVICDIEISLTIGVDHRVVKAPTLMLASIAENKNQSCYARMPAVRRHDEGQADATRHACAGQSECHDAHVVRVGVP